MAALLFTYVDDFTYATDPATLLDVNVGDTIHVKARWLGETIEYTSVVKKIGRDEYGLYFHVEYVTEEAFQGYLYHDTWSLIASTVTDQIRLISPVALKPPTT